MSDPISSTQFSVDLEQLHEAIGSVSSSSEAVGEMLALMAATFNQAETAWSSPSSVTFTQVSQWFTKASGDLHTLLDEIVSRLNTAYETYVQAEQTNTDNAT
jgi:WXG100 family type VII secretion target